MLFAVTILVVIITLMIIVAYKDGLQYSKEKAYRNGMTVSIVSLFVLIIIIIGIVITYPVGDYG